VKQLGQGAEYWLDLIFGSPCSSPPCHPAGRVPCQSLVPAEDTAQMTSHHAVEPGRKARSIVIGVRARLPSPHVQSLAAHVSFEMAETCRAQAASRNVAYVLSTVAPQPIQISSI
jgi:hypothetical protein